MVKYNDETEIVHGVKYDYPTKDHVAPCHMTSIYRFDTADDGSKLFNGEQVGESFLYTRANNPTIDQLQRKMTELERGDDAVATSSGMSAIASLVMALASPGDNFISCSTLYGGTYAYFTNEVKRLNIHAKFLNSEMCNDRSIIEKSIDDATKFIYIETPANPTLSILDISMLAEVAKLKDIPLIVDNTFATPYLQKPLELGASMVVHSATKYLNGHGDLIAGIIVGKNPYMEKIKEYCFHMGPIMSPFNAWLILRGLKTLAIRMDRQCESAEYISRMLDGDDRIKKVYYPGLDNQIGQEKFDRQMKKPGAMVSFEVNDGIKGGKSFLDNLELITRTVSLGDVESLAQHPASMTHSTYTPEERKKAGIDDGLIRLSVGIENIGDLTRDINNALKDIPRK